MSEKKIEDSPGEFRMLHKQILVIDESYQRKHIRWHIVDAIANDFSWVQFGVILVAQRPNGRYYVFDGQHRKYGADRIESVSKIPCMVYQSSGEVDEAEWFLNIQANRSPVTAIDKFNAKITSRNPVTLSCDQMIRESGYSVSGDGKKWTVSIVKSIENAMKKDADAARSAWLSCCLLFDGDPVQDKIFRGLFVLDRRLDESGLGRLTYESCQSQLKKLTVEAVKDAIEEAIRLFRRPAGGKTRNNAMVYAEGILGLLNTKRRGSSKIPSLYEKIQSGGDDAC